MTLNTAINNSLILNCGKAITLSHWFCIIPCHVTVEEKPSIKRVPGIVWIRAALSLSSSTSFESSLPASFFLSSFFSSFLSSFFFFLFFWPAAQLLAFEWFKRFLWLLMTRRGPKAVTLPVLPHDGEEGLSGGWMDEESRPLSFQVQHLFPADGRVSQQLFCSCTHSFTSLLL